ncbi:vomeronasal type-2 receptor 116-like [Erethizon dorsatum]
MPIHCMTVAAGDRVCVTHSFSTRYLPTRCLWSLEDSIHKGGDVVIGGFFPLYTLQPVQQLKDPSETAFSPQPRQLRHPGCLRKMFALGQRGADPAIPPALRPALPRSGTRPGKHARSDSNRTRCTVPLRAAGAPGAAPARPPPVPPPRDAPCDPLAALAAGRRLPSVEKGLFASLEPKSHQYMLAFVFAIEEINKNPQLLPSMPLGCEPCDVFDACTVLENSTFGTSLELYEIPQLTYGPFDPILSDHGQFPSLYQMAPKDTSLAHGMVSLMLHFSWNRMVKPSKYPEDIFLARLWWRLFNCSGSESSCKSLENCSSSSSLEGLPGHSFDTAMSDASYDIYDAQHPFLKNVRFNNPAGEPVNINQKDKLGAEYDILNFWNFPEGLGLKVKIGKFSPHFPHDQQLSLSEEMIEWASQFRQTPSSVCSAGCHPGFRKLPREGKAVCYDCVPCAENEISNETDMDHCLRCANHQYPNREQKLCLQKSVTFLAYEDPLGMALTCTALCFSILTGVILGLFVKHRDTPIVRANNQALSYTLLISLTCCFLCSSLFMGRPNAATCVLQQTTFGVVFTMAVSTVLTKTTTVVLAFKVTAPGRRMRHLLVSGAPNSIIPICSLIQLTFRGVWMGTNPPYVDTDAHSEHSHIIIVCNKGSLTTFYCVLGYLGSLALVSFTMAFLARNLPDTFNEAKFLTFSTLVFCSVWVTFLPVYHSTKGKVMVAMEVFPILASRAGLLGCIFAPKCYIIFIRPEKICLKGLRDKIDSRSK